MEIYPRILSRLRFLPGISSVKRNILYYFIFFLISLRSLFWIAANKIALGGDFLFPMVLQQYARLLFSWDRINLGLPTDDGPRIILLPYVSSVLGILTGVSIHTWQVTYLILLYFGTMVFTYHTALALTGASQRMAAAVAAVSFVTFPYILSDAVISSISFSWVYFLVALTAYAATNAIQKQTVRSAILSRTVLRSLVRFTPQLLVHHRHVALSVPLRPSSL